MPADPSNCIRFPRCANPLFSDHILIGTKLVCERVQVLVCSLALLVQSMAKQKATKQLNVKYQNSKAPLKLAIFKKLASFLGIAGWVPSQKG
jgi:hypothetical protein